MTSSSQSHILNNIINTADPTDENGNTIQDNNGLGNNLNTLSSLSHLTTTNNINNNNNTNNNTNNNNNNNNNSNTPIIPSSNSNPHFSSPYQKPLSLTKDRIPVHLQHYMNSGSSIGPNSFERDNIEEIREVTPTNITLSRNIGSGPSSPTSSSSPSSLPNPTTTLNNNNNINNNNNSNNNSNNNNSNSNNNSRKNNSNNNNNNNHINSSSSNNDSSDYEGGNDHQGSDDNDRQPSMSNAIVPAEDRSIVKTNQYIEITEYLNFPQSEAAKRLGMPTSTLSKRWKEAARGRKWPFRKVSKIDKEIMTLLHNIPPGGEQASLPTAVDSALVALLKKRQKKLRPVFIRV